MLARYSNTRRTVNNQTFTFPLTRWSIPRFFFGIADPSTQSFLCFYCHSLIGWHMEQIRHVALVIISVAPGCGLHAWPAMPSM